MENYSYSSYPDSGDSSPRSREIECDQAAGTAAWDDLPPPCCRVKLMCSYGGRIQPRSRDSQLAYVGGDTKILAVDRSVRYPAFVAKLTSLYGSDGVILKYQLPGEDLDALISVTNDEDLEHMMIEYDRLHRTGSKPVARLRLFLFPAFGKASQERAWFADAPPAAAAVTPAATATESPDFLFGFDKGFVPPPAVKVKEAPVENVVSEAVPVKSEPEPEPVVSPAEMQKLQIAENNNLQQLEQQQPQKEENLPRVYPPEFYVHQVQEKALEPPSEPAAPTYWQDHQRNMAPPPAARFASIVSGDQQFYLIPANSGLFPTSAAHGQGFYTTMQRIIPGPAYTVAPPPPTKPAYDSGVRGQAVDVSSGYGLPPGSAYDNGAGYPAYDSAGRAVYYTGTAPTYQTVGNVALAAAESKVLKPSQVS